MGDERKRLVIYGLGNNFKMLFTGRIQRSLQQKYDVIGYVDKNSDSTCNIFDGMSCFHDIPGEKFDYICITSTLYYGEIKEELLARSIDKDKILPSSFWLAFCRSNYLPMDFIQGKGVEIGGPSDIFQAVYDSDCLCDGVNYNMETVWGNNSTSIYRWNGKRLGTQIIADATNLELINDETYDFVLSSNNLEHIANPMKAISEFLRVLKGGKLIVILVPCKQYTFDHRREDTTFEHILKDYVNGIRENDLTHLEEILEKHDLSLDKPAGTKENFAERSRNNFKNRCLHHHVFSNRLLKDIADYFQLEILENTVYDQNLYLAAVKKM